MNNENNTNSNNNQDPMSLSSLYGITSTDENKEDIPVVEEKTEEVKEEVQPQIEQPVVENTNYVEPGPVIPIPESVIEDKKNNDTDELVRSFVGKNYDQFVNMKFNIGAFFLSFLYLFYRKMYLHGVVFFILSMFLVRFGYYIPILLCVALALTVNKMYLNFAKMKVLNIKSSNLNIGIEELNNICTKKGGTSIISPIIGFILIIISVSVLYIVFFFLGFASLLFGLSNMTVTENQIISDHYDGAIYYNTKININDYFKVDVPSRFNNKSLGFGYEYSYSGNTGVLNDCQFSIYEVSNFNDGDKLINEMVEYNKDYNPSTPVTTSINNVEWKWFKYTDDLGTKYTYLTKKDNHLFIMYYIIEEDADKDCEGYQSNIIKSVKSK